MKTKTSTPKTATIARNWILIDLSGQTLGRVCTKIAQTLMGKNRLNFSYHLDQGDYVVAINSDQIRVTGKKLKNKLYQSYSGHPGGLKELTLKEMLQKDSRLVIRHGVYGMLPKNKLRDRRMVRLKIFADANHPYSDKINHSKLDKSLTK